MTRMPLQRWLRFYSPFGFPVSGKSWENLRLLSVVNEETIGRPPAFLPAVKRLAHLATKKVLETDKKAPAVQPGQLVSGGIIVDILRYIIDLYCRQENPGVMRRGEVWIESHTPEKTVLSVRSGFVGHFPPLPVIKAAQSGNQFLGGKSEGMPHGEIVIAESIILGLVNANPAFQPFRFLFGDDDLRRHCPYELFLTRLEAFFAQQPAFSYLGQTLFDALRAPMRACPDSLEGQLDYIRRHWAAFLPEELVETLLLALDILSEERRMRGFGPGPAEALTFGGWRHGDASGYPETEAFSRDADWMSNVVLMAKSVYVWLDQLSKKYGRHIRLLSDIPDEELDRLAAWGFTGLWLIGLWERSPASQKIKQIMGNPEAAPSAYSIYDYSIAADLGGEKAYGQLRERAWRRGIRLASDMVPNHMGLYSRWTIEHPDWFIQASSPPFPWYQFTGANLSFDDRVIIQIEDGYWDRRDAAVVFKRIDQWSGEVRYIYHGNDGTSTPWNDTAQLNFLIAEVREAVIQTILHVARLFPIIRFDAAMTLAKRHYQRLWFPPPGEGGAIPTRAEHKMTRAEFEAAFPREFWREVVDRVTAEVPDTLLLAEAFWLMEGYFVRTLGMHRVYNSAFMNMLKMEDNAKYRLTIRNVLEFSPEVLKRFVNFMNNPDERTAIDQFGRGDKYFGVALMMVTMPGLPMFGHGQIEGFTEKYGMEYYRAYWDEPIDYDLIRRHEREIFPLMRRRRLFSRADNFAFYDFVTPDGHVDENVFAYSNRAGDERAVILYNNAYNTTSGRISLATAINTGTVEQPHFLRKTLAEALGLKTGDRYYYRYCDYHIGKEYLRSGKDIADHGLFADLRGYQYYAFIDFREIFDHDGSWGALNNRLMGAGVSNIDSAYEEMKLEPLHRPLRNLLTILHAGEFLSEPPTADRLVPSIREFLSNFAGSETESTVLSKRLADGLVQLHQVTTAVIDSPEFPGMESLPLKELHNIVAAGLVIDLLGRQTVGEKNGMPAEGKQQWLERYLLRNIIIRHFQEMRAHDSDGYFDALLAAILGIFADPFSTLSAGQKEAIFQELFADRLAGEYLMVNEYENTLWFNRERFERLVAAGLLLSLAANDTIDQPHLPTVFFEELKNLTGYAEEAGFRVGPFLDMLE